MAVESGLWWRPPRQVTLTSNSGQNEVDVIPEYFDRTLGFSLASWSSVFRRQTRTGNVT